MSARARTAVIHLVRQANGRAPFERFLRSYEQLPAGLEHDLVLLFKGFERASAGERAAYLERAAAHAPLSLELSDAGTDVTVYFAAAQLLEHERVCFLNSFSEIVAPGWLGLLDGALAAPGAGAAGATGSWSSQVSYELFQLGAPSAYQRALCSRREAREVMYELADTPLPSPLAGWLHTALMVTRRARTMGRFPAPHLRTNAFLVDRALLGSLRAGRAASKLDAYALESGRHSITAQLRARGLTAVVVDRTGTARPVPEWPAADVYAQAGQEDLLVADNQTRLYAAATTRQRAVLSALSWGDRARPAANEASSV
jgi:hypothetical protein